MKSRFFRPVASTLVRQFSQQASHVPQLQVVHVKLDLDPFAQHEKKKNSWYEMILGNRTSWLETKFARQDEVDRAIQFSQCVMARGDALHQGRADAALVNQLDQDLQQLVNQDCNETTRATHTHISTPEFTFYLGSGPLSLHQFQQILVQIKSYSEQLSLGTSFHLGSFPVMVKRSMLEKLISHHDLLNMRFAEEIEYAFAAQEDAHELVNVAIAGHKNELVCYSKIAPSDVDYLYPVGYRDSLETSDQRDIGHNASKSKLAFASFKFNQRYLYIHCEMNPLIFTFELCRNNWHGAAKQNLQSALMSAEKPLFHVDIDTVRAFHEVSASGALAVLNRNTPALLVSVNDAQKGSELLLFSREHEDIDCIVPQLSSAQVSQVYFGLNYSEKTYLTSLAHGLNLDEREDKQKGEGFSFTPGKT